MNFPILVAKVNPSPTLALLSVLFDIISKLAYYKIIIKKIKKS